MISMQETPDERRHDWRLLSIAVFLFGFGFAIYGAVFVKYITDELGVGPKQMGILESCREIPGLLAVFIAGIAASFRETRVGSVCLVFSALGVAATGFVHSYTALVATTVFWSIFMHQWFTSSSAIPIALAKGENSGRHLGRMAGIGASATVLAFVVVYFLTARHVPYPAYFVLSAVFILAAGLTLLPMSAHGSTTNRPRLLYRREYRLYYGLTFLEGCRRQIFTTFALFALVQVVHTPLPQIATLMLINAVASFFAAGPVGRMVDKIGERRAMTIYYIGIAFAFAGYALSTHALTLKILYVIDNILFSFGVSLTTYLNKLVRPGELMPSLAMGQTMNHIAAVAVPITGGLLWAKFGYHAPFWTGVIAAIASLILTQTMERRTTAVPQATV